jgi:hypothetical protein
MMTTKMRAVLALVKRRRIEVYIAVAHYPWNSPMTVPSGNDKTQSLAFIVT